MKYGNIHAATDSTQEQVFHGPIHFLKKPAYLLLFVSIILYVGLECGFSYFATTLFETRLNAGHFGALSISLFWTGMALSRLINGVLCLSPKKTVTAYFFILGACFAVLIPAASPAVGLVLSGLLGFGCGPVWSNLIAMGGSEFPRQSASAIGLLASGCGIGGALFPILMGYIADHMDLSIAYLLLAVTSCVGGLLCFLYAKTSKTDL